MLIEYTKNGRSRTVNAKVGKLLIGRGLAREVVESRQILPEPAVPAAQTYQTRVMTAAPADAPYGYKADGTPRKRPGRPAAPKAGEEE